MIPSYLINDKKNIYIYISYIPPNCSSAEACAVSPSDRLTIHWYIPRSSLLIPFSFNNSDCLPVPGSCRPSLYQVIKCGPACGCVLTSHLNSALPPKWTLSSGGVTSTCNGAVTISLENIFLVFALLITSLLGGKIEIYWKSFQN